jgi:hypothetical protein
MYHGRQHGRQWWRPAACPWDVSLLLTVPPLVALVVPLALAVAAVKAGPAGKSSGDIAAGGNRDAESSGPEAESTHNTFMSGDKVA